MIVFYPKQYEKNAPNNRLGVEVIVSDSYTFPTSSGMYDTFVIIVKHLDGVGKLNYCCEYADNGNLHVINTNIDCNFHSNNLETLIDKFKQTEEIWLT